MRRRDFLMLIPAAVLAACSTPGVTRRATATIEANPTSTSNPPAKPAAAAPTNVPTNSNPTSAPAPSSNDPLTAHWNRLMELDPIFRSQGLEAWLRAAGLTWDNIKFDARQVEEETSPEGRILISGVQVDAQNLKVEWPNIVTTDQPGRISKSNHTYSYQPDMRNGSILYTGVVANGQVTVWISGYSWGQFTSRLGVADQLKVDDVQQPAAQQAVVPSNNTNQSQPVVPSTNNQSRVAQVPSQPQQQAQQPAAQAAQPPAAPTATPRPMPTKPADPTRPMPTQPTNQVRPAPTMPPDAQNSSGPTKADLMRLGTIIQWLDDNGTAGAQVKFNQNWSAPEWVDQIQKNGAKVSSVSAGEVASIWVKPAFRNNLK